MKSIIFSCLLFVSISINAQTDSTPTLKSVLLEQLKTTHNVKDWFVPVNNALEGLTAEQAMWKDSSGNHSIAQLASHLLFWNKQMLAKFRGEKPDAFSGDNKETFSVVDNSSWPVLVKELDELSAIWEQVVASAPEDKLKEWYSNIAHIGTHNAYHVGQIMYIRKMKGWWDDEKGVK